jgi:uncharacterized protein YoxC
VEFCDHHLDQLRKMGQNCSDVAVLKSQTESLAAEINQINQTIFGDGDTNSLKSRIKGAEDAVSGLKDMVLENREIVKAGMGDMQKSMVKAIVILISVATVVIGGMFGLLWGEIKATQQVVQVER